ncbi:Hint domain-containing protein [Epibacterium ulvae]|uniref:Hint domain-containing protein n=1 Tax=Epibacterium ulvae TaxID=1156985 RepID=UPI001BFC3165|nr:Hint domain-containing protein [Epibacterium ulvae]MBT8153220.1 Hint domain-containing protein [Epibacterium ulvae]
MVAASELNYDTSATAEQLAATIFGDGVSVETATYTGDPLSSAIYSGGDARAFDATPSDTGVIFSTGRAADYTNSTGDANQSNSRTTNTDGETDQSDFNAAAGTRTFDASYLDVEFIPTGDTLTMQFVFASEEYPEFQGSVFQDFVGVWVNDEFVELGFGTGDTDPGNINDGANQNLYLDNSDSDFNTEMDGLTITLSLKVDVNPGEINSIRIGIADVADSSFDSSLLIAADSVQTTLIANQDVVHVRPDESKTVDVLANDESGNSGTLTITHINGQEVAVDDVITLGTGQEVQLNEDGTLTLLGDGDAEDFTFTYTVSDGTNSDVGIVEASSIPCFVAGTRIATPSGERLVETLAVGDWVRTRDNGDQPIRWIGQRTVPASGRMAPIRISQGAIGNQRDLWLSPQHRVLRSDASTALLFGEDEVLVSAQALVNDATITRQPGAWVTYVHMMFDDHQIVFSEGVPSESYLPGDQTHALFDPEVLDEICTIFPELDPSTGNGYGLAVRPVLRGFEGALLSRPSD